MVKKHGRPQAEAAAYELSRQDRELLAMFEGERLSYARLGARLGISRMAAWYRVAAARRRQALVVR